MTPENFCYWLQGFFEMQTPKRPAAIALNEEQTKMIEEHLALVFKTKAEVPAMRLGDLGPLFPADPWKPPGGAIC